MEAKIISSKNVYGKVSTKEHMYNDGFGIQYHDTIVLKQIKGIITLNSGGWLTVTTKSRINDNLPTGFYLYQKKGIWYVETPKDNYVFFDGIKFNLLGECLNPKKDLVKKHESHQKKINATVKRWSKRIDNNNLSTGGGECWGISMGINKCNECQYLLKPSCGGGYRFINQALTHSGYRCPAIFFCSSDGTPCIKTTQENKDLILKSIKNYLIKGGK